MVPVITSAWLSGAVASVVICLLRLLQYRMTLHFLDKHLSRSGSAARQEVCVILAQRTMTTARPYLSRCIRTPPDQLGVDLPASRVLSPRRRQVSTATDVRGGSLRT